MLCLGLTIWAVLPYGLGWPFWLGMAVAAAQVIWHFTLIRNRSREGCFVAFSKSHYIGMAILWAWRWVLRCVKPRQTL